MIKDTEANQSLPRSSPNSTRFRVTCQPIFAPGQVQADCSPFLPKFDVPGEKERPASRSLICHQHLPSSIQASILTPLLNWC